MRSARTPAMTTLLLAWVLAVAVTGSVLGCGPKTGTGSGSLSPAGRAGAKSVLERLHSDPRASLLQVDDTVTKANSARVTFMSNSASGQASLDGVMSFDENARAELTMTDVGKGTRTTLRLADNMVFMNIPEADMAVVAGRKWITMGSRSVAAEGKGLADRIYNSSPLRTVKIMMEGDGLAVVGDEVIDGVTTVHYVATMSAERYVKAVGANGEAAKADGSDVKLHAWIDERYQFRRGKSVSASSVGTYDYTDYGLPITVEAPPAAETIGMGKYYSLLANPPK